MTLRWGLFVFVAYFVTVFIAVVACRGLIAFYATRRQTCSCMHTATYIHTTVTDHKKRESLTIRLRAVAPVVVIVAVVDIVVDISGKKSNSCAVVVVVSFVNATVSVAAVVVVASVAAVVVVAVTSSSSSGAFVVVVVAAAAFVVGCVLIVRSSLTFIVAFVVTLCTNFVSFYISYTMHKFTCATRLSLCSLSPALSFCLQVYNCSLFFVVFFFFFCFSMLAVHVSSCQLVAIVVVSLLKR